MPSQTDQFEIREGLQLGYGLTPVLFNKNNCTTTDKPKMYHYVQIREYADNVVKIGKSTEAVHKYYETLTFL